MLRRSTLRFFSLLLVGSTAARAQDGGVTLALAAPRAVRARLR